MKKFLHQSLIICVLLGILLSMTGCSEKQSPRLLPEKELAQANQWFSGVADTGDQIGAGEISCFFTCYYSDPREIDLEEFLKYCPVSIMLTDEDAREFQDWLKASQWPDPEGIFQKPSDFYVPVRRLANADVSSVLMQYAGIATSDLEGFGNAVYLEQYDAFYNSTSDYAPGYFQCIGGEKDGSFVRFWSEISADGTRDVLTLELVNEQYLIRSFLQEKAD